MPRAHEPATACHVQADMKVEPQWRRWIAVSPGAMGAALWIAETPAGSLRVYRELPLEGVDAHEVGRRIAEASIPDLRAYLRAVHLSASWHIDVLLEKTAFAVVEPIGSYAELLEQGMLSYDPTDGPFNERVDVKQELRLAKFSTQIATIEDSTFDHLRDLLRFQPADYQELDYDRKTAFELSKRDVNLFLQYMDAVEGTVSGEWPKIKFSSECRETVAAIGAVKRDQEVENSFVRALLIGLCAPPSLSSMQPRMLSRGVMPQPRAWVLYARWKGLAKDVKAGEYEIEPGTTPRELLMKMVSGQVLLHSFTIVDGWRVQDMLEALRRNPDIAPTVPPSASPEQQASLIMERLGSPGINAEGQFLPETYRFAAGTTDVEVLRQAHTALTRELDEAWQSREPDLPLQNSRDLLIMASIVEKESGLPQELGKIAGLYLHRLSIGMRLQADPTIIYGMGERYEGDIHSVDLRADGPYNTYTRVGLPPTPICLVSAAVIRATARPEKTDALYFVASGNGDGSHVFSATLEAHNAAVAAYLVHLRQKAAQGSVR